MSATKIWFNALWRPCLLLLIAAWLVISIRPFQPGTSGHLLQLTRDAGQVFVVLAGAWLVRNLLLVMRWHNGSASVRRCDGCEGLVAARSPREALARHPRCWRCGALH